MRFTERYERESVPEWMDCYINYKQMKFVIKTIRDCVRERQLIVHSLRAINQEDSQPRLARPVSSDTKELSKSYLNKFIELGDEANMIFQHNLNNSLDLFLAFVQFKYGQIQNKFEKSKTFYNVVVAQDIKYNKKILLPFIEYLFVESFNLKLMVQSNIEAERRIVNKHIANADGFYVTPQPRIETVFDVTKFDKFYRDVEKFYAFNVSEHRRGEDKYRLRKLAEVKADRPRWLFYVGILVGLFIGTGLFLGIFLENKGVALEQDFIFNRDFPLWRGIAFIIMYIWSLAINLYVYEKHNITHRFILENNHTQYPTSSKTFAFASIMSILFMVFFTLYALDLAGVISMGRLPSQYLPLFVWVPFVLILFNPLSLFYYRTRGYTFNMTLKVICSLVIPITFPIIWATDQLVSLFIIFQDMVYTICFYTKINFNYIESTDLTGCRDAAAKAAFIFCIVVYFYRIVQCLRVGLCDGPYWKKTQFYNTFKYTLCLITAILSYAWTESNSQSVFIAWIVFAVVTTIFAYFYDVGNDWDLLHWKSKNFLLRDRITFRKSAYYICIVLNFVLRCGWVFYISPNIVKNMLGSVELFILVFGAVEIVRRGIYNAIRVEVEHVRDCECLRALPKQYERLQSQMDQLLQMDRKNIPSSSVQRIIEPGNEFFKWSTTYQEELTKKQQEFKETIKTAKQTEWQDKQKIKEIRKQEREMKAFLNNNLY